MKKGKGGGWGERNRLIITFTPGALCERGLIMMVRAISTPCSDGVWRRKEKRKKVLINHLQEIGVTLTGPHHKNSAIQPCQSYWIYVPVLPVLQALPNLASLTGTTQSCQSYRHYQVLPVLPALPPSLASLTGTSQSCQSYRHFPVLPV